MFGKTPSVAMTPWDNSILLHVFGEGLMRFSPNTSINSVVMCCRFVIFVVLVGVCQALLV